MKTDGSHTLQATEYTRTPHAHRSSKVRTFTSVVTVCFTRFLLLEEQSAPEVAEREVVYATCAHVSATGKPTLHFLNSQGHIGLASGGVAQAVLIVANHTVFSVAGYRNVVCKQLILRDTNTAKSTLALDLVVYECRVFGLNSVA
jgi:hypothetical protein